MNRSQYERNARRVEAAYRRLWAALHRDDDDGDGLGQHERELLAHVGEGVGLTALAGHLLLPKSTASVLVKDLERRGFLVRRRHESDERRLVITLTEQGRAAVAADHVLDLEGLAAALRRLAPEERAEVVRLVEKLADVAQGT